MSYPRGYIRRVMQFGEQGYDRIDFRTYDTDWDSGLSHRLGQNSNNSVRIPTSSSARSGRRRWNLYRRTDGKVAKTLPARELWEKIAGAACLRRSGVQTTPHQRVAYLPGERSDQRLQPLLGIHVPGRYGLQSGVLEPDDLPPADGGFDVVSYEHAVRLWTMVLEISVLMAQFPSREIAQLSYEYRTLGLGYANIGGLLMTMGLGYDSGRAAPSPAP